MEQDDVARIPLPTVLMPLSEHQGSHQSVASVPPHNDVLTALRADIRIMHDEWWVPGQDPLILYQIRYGLPAMNHMRDSEFFISKRWQINARLENLVKRAIALKCEKWAPQEWTMLSAIKVNTIVAWSIISAFQTIMPLRAQQGLIYRQSHFPLLQMSVPLPNDIKNNARVIMYIMDCITADGLRLGLTHLYKRILTPEGLDTRTWSRIRDELGEIDITKYITGKCASSHNFAMFKLLHRTNSTKNHVVQAITDTPEIARIMRSDGTMLGDRFARSFRNGIYMMDEDRFLDYRQDAAEIQQRNIISFDYLEQHFDYYPECRGALYRHIPIPILRSIMDYQGFSPEVQHFHLVFLGRCGYPLSYFDRWEVVVINVGLGGAGKSIFVFMATKFAPEAYVAYFSGVTQEKFCLANMATKMLIVMNECKGLPIDNDTFKGLVSGDPTDITAKFKDATNVHQWRTPMYFAGNGLPMNMRDEGGSAGRRVILFQWDRAVEDKTIDTTLRQQLSVEWPRILLACNRAYLHQAYVTDKKGIWKEGILPQYFHQTRENLQLETNNLSRFLGEHALTFGPVDTHYMKLDDFKDAYNEWAKRNNLPSVAWSSAFYNNSFRQRNLSVTGRIRRDWPLGSSDARKVQTVWILGVKQEDGLANMMIEQAPDE